MDFGEAAKREQAARRIQAFRRASQCLVAMCLICSHPCTCLQECTPPRRVQREKAHATSERLQRAHREQGGHGFGHLTSSLGPQCKPGLFINRTLMCLHDCNRFVVPAAGSVATTKASDVQTLLRRPTWPECASKPKHESPNSTR